jgi:outer membrane protein assembly factor BamB
MRSRTTNAIALVILSLTVAYADNWPQWRGPTGNGLSNEKNLPLRWTNEENVAWKLGMPSWSGSTPVIWRDRIFLNVPRP